MIRVRLPLAVAPFLAQAIAREVDRALGLVLRAEVEPDGWLVEVGRAKDQPVWDRWYWLVAMVCIIGLEWTLRRRFGYI